MEKDKGSLLRSIVGVFRKETSGVFCVLFRLFTSAICETNVQVCVRALVVGTCVCCSRCACGVSVLGVRVWVPGVYSGCACGVSVLGACVVRRMRAECACVAVIET